MKQPINASGLPKQTSIPHEDEEGEEEMDENEMAMSGNTFVGNTKRDPNKQSLLLKSEQGTVVNRFKDSVE